MQKYLLKSFFLMLFVFFASAGCQNKNESTSSQPAPAPIARIAYQWFFDMPYAPFEIQFKDSSSGEIDTYLWEFGDGTISNEKNPKHTFTKDGNFDVKLTVTGKGGSDVAIKTFNILPTPAKPTVKLTFIKSSGFAPTKVFFESNCSGIISDVKWDFGNGNGFVNGKCGNNSYIYNTAGTYTAKIRVSNVGGVSESSVTFTIEERPPLKFTVKGQSFEMIYVTAGSFMMGFDFTKVMKDPDFNAVPIHKVNLSGYYIMKTEVTQNLYNAVIGTNPSLNKGCGECPVEYLSYWDVVTFNARLGAALGTPTTLGHFDLPTEAEWEFAAKGGNKSKGFNYAGSNNPNEVGWIYQPSQSFKTMPIGLKKPNELGLLDMTGNVAEATKDWLINYSVSEQTNPVFSGNEKPSGARYGRVKRGTNGPETVFCYVTRRASILKDSDKNFDYGIRLVFRPKE